MVSAANKTALEAEHSARIWFLFLDFSGDPFYACTGNRTYVFDGNNYLGVGEIAGISDIADTTDVAARPVTITLSGVDAPLRTHILNRQNYKGRSAQIHRGLMDSNFDLIDDPFIVWSGRMDVASMLYDQEKIAQIVCEPLATRLLRPNISRYSDEDHQLRHAGDKFFEFLAQMEKKDVTWGGDRVAPTVGGFGRGLGSRFNRSFSDG